MRYSFQPEQLLPDSRAAFDTILERRGNVAPMYRTLIASPDVALSIEELSARLWKGGLPQSVLETVFLVVSRKFHCDEQWKRHAPKALAAGVSEEGVDAIAKGLCPSGPLEVRTAYRVAKRLLAGRRIPNLLWAQARTTYGDSGLADLCAFLGVACLVAMSINLQDP